MGYGRLFESGWKWRWQVKRKLPSSGFVWPSCRARPWWVLRLALCMLATSQAGLGGRDGLAGCWKSHNSMTLCAQIRCAGCLRAFLYQREGTRWCVTVDCGEAFELARAEQDDANAVVSIREAVHYMETLTLDKQIPTSLRQARRGVCPRQSSIPAAKVESWSF